MEQPFIIKYKPTQIDDFILDETKKKTINFLIDMDLINILFVGDNGSGKSTLTDIIIRQYYKDNIEVNNLSSNNILYINTLKEQGIHYYRNEVKTFCQTKNSNSKKKFLIIDDIDVINEQGQQVFRSCIDKYSNNVHFICTCTNLQKVIENLQSRQTIIRINTLEKNSISKILHNVKANENITIDQASIDTILNLSNNSVSIMLNYMDKCRLLRKKINNDIAEKICTDISYDLFNRYTTIVLDRNITYSDKSILDAINILYDIYNNGYSVIDILDNYFVYIKNANHIKDKIKFIMIKLLCKYISVFYEIHEEKLELALFTNNLYQKIHSL